MSDESQPDTDTGDSKKRQLQTFFADFRMPLLGGATAGLVALAVVASVGQVGDTEGRILLESAFPTTRFLCSAVMTASATILALMLTLLSFSNSMDFDFKPLFYRRVRDIALMDTLAFTGATLLLLFHSVPMDQSNQVFSEWYGVVYYAMIGATSLMGGILITIVLMLYRTARDLIYVLGPYDDKRLIQDEASGRNSQRQ